MPLNKLYFSIDKREWKEILKTEIWDLKNHEILAHLFLNS